MGQCKCHGHAEQADACGCSTEKKGARGECHGEEEEGDIRGQIVKIAVATALLIAASIVDHCVEMPMWATLLMYLIPYLAAGHGVLRESAERIADGDLFNEDSLMSIATLGALAIGFLPGGEPEFAEAVFVMLFFLVGETFEQYAEGRSRDSIGHLMDLKPAEAHLITSDGEKSVDPEILNVGDRILVRPGEKIPADGVVESGVSSLDTVALTGESAPREVAKGDKVLSGCVNQQGVLTVCVEKAYAESTAAKVLQLVEESNAKKSKSEAFIARFARVYTPIVVIAALVVAFLPPLFCDGGYAENFTMWLGRALTFLVISCPCALVISVPLTFFGGIGGASRRGVLIKGASYIDALANAGVAVFDKTGTLTEGRFCVTSVCPKEVSADELIHLAAHVETFSTHPIAVSLVEEYKRRQLRPCHACTVTDVEEIAGHGLVARVGGRRVAVGNAKLMVREGADIEDHGHVGTVIHVSIDGRYAGHVVVSDVVKGDAREAIAALKDRGVRTVMLTGDRKEVANDIARNLGLDEWHSELLPADKVAHVERLLGELPEGKSLAFVGDGINDAPVLARADIGIAMGALGSDAAIEAADVVLMDDKPSKVAMAIGLAKRVIGIARQNVAFAIGIKVAVLILALFGVANMWMAVFADVGVTVLAVFNAMRAMR